MCMNIFFYKGNNVLMRTCSEVSIDDCQRVNNDFICICNKELCNGNTRDFIFNKFNYMSTIIDDEHKEANNSYDDDDNDDDDDDENENESGNDDILLFIETTTQITDSTDEYEASNEVLFKVSVSTAESPINEAVNSNFKKQLLLLLYFLMKYF